MGVTVLVTGMNGAVPLDVIFVVVWIGAALLFQRAGTAGARKPGGLVEA